MKDIYEAYKLYKKKKEKEEYETRIRGMSRAGRHFGRLGAQKRREGFHPLGFKKALEWFSEGKLFFDDSEENNKNKAHCKICGKQLIKGEGTRVIIYADNWYNLSFYFGCEKCKNKITGNIILGV